MPEIDCLSLIDEGKCHADCCGIVPLSLDLWNRCKHLVYVIPEKTIKDESTVVPITHDLSCVFLHRKLYQCLIYLERPEPCKCFGNEGDPLLTCPYAKPDGMRRTRAERKRVIRSRRKLVDQTLKPYRR